MDDETPYDGEVQVKAAAFLNMGATTPLNELTVVMDVSPVLEHNVCCALVPHNAKEGCLWWKVCGGTGAHNHQGATVYGITTALSTFLVIACDGVWDVLSDDDAVAIAAKHFGKPKDAAEAVVRQAYSKGSRDNLTATVVQFFWQAERSSELMQTARKKTEEE
jgi:hypothetical protein